MKAETTVRIPAKIPAEMTARIPAEIPVRTTATDKAVLL